MMSNASAGAGRDEVTDSGARTNVSIPPILAPNRPIVTAAP